MVSRHGFGAGALRLGNVGRNLKLVLRPGWSLDVAASFGRRSIVWTSRHGSARLRSRPEIGVVTWLGCSRSQAWSRKGPLGVWCRDISLVAQSGLTSLVLRHGFEVAKWVGLLELRPENFGLLKVVPRPRFEVETWSGLEGVATWL